MRSGIIPMTGSEMAAAAKALGQDWIASGLANEASKRRQLVVDVFSAFYRERFGPAPGTTAFNPRNGDSAIRFYDTVTKKFRWSIQPNPEAAAHDDLSVQIRHVDSLPGEEARITNPWEYSERQWSELVLAIGVSV